MCLFDSFSQAVICNNNNVNVSNESLKHTEENCFDCCLDQVTTVFAMGM